MRIAPEIVLSEDERLELTKLSQSRLTSVRLAQRAQIVLLVERFFRDITTERLRRGIFTSVPELVAAIDEYVTHHNTDPKPFIWTKSARDIL
jgi:hypothetical protein